MNEGNEDKKIKSLEKGIQVIEYIWQSSEDVSVSQLYKELNINKTTIYRILQTYLMSGYLEQDPYTNRYRPTTKILSISNQILNRMEIRLIARNYLKELSYAIQDSVHLAILDGTKTVIIDKHEYGEGISVKFHIGRKSDLYSTGTGKIFLAYMDDKDLDHYFASEKLVKHTPNTHCEPQSLIEELKECRKLGYALDKEENNIGISCIAAPIRDFSGKVIAAISATGQTHRIEENMEKIKSEVILTAKKISQQLGHR